MALQSNILASAEEKEQTDFEKRNLDLALPDSPAFTVLGLTPHSVVRPSSPRELATSLLNGVDPRGNLQTGVAVDTVPYLLFEGKQLQLKDYEGTYFKRFLARTQTSLALVKGTSEGDKSSRLSLGFRMTPWDEGDPHLDQELRDCFAQASQKSLPEPDPVLNKNNVDDITPVTQKDLKEMKSQLLEKSDPEKLFANAISDCRAAARDRNWNAAAWTIGVAPTWISETGTLGSLQGDGVGLWTSLSYGFKGIKFLDLEHKAQTIFHVRYRSNEHVSDSSTKGAFFEQESVLVGTRFRVGTQKFNVSLEGDFVHADPKTSKPNDYYRMVVGADILLGGNVWLEFALGGEADNRTGNHVFVLPLLKWGLPSESSFAPPKL